jgi:hypothetical protein
VGGCGLAGSAAVIALVFIQQPGGFKHLAKLRHVLTKRQEAMHASTVAPSPVMSPPKVDVPSVCTSERSV